MVGSELFPIWWVLNYFQYGGFWTISNMVGSELFPWVLNYFQYGGFWTISNMVGSELFPIWWVLNYFQYGGPWNISNVMGSEIFPMWWALKYFQSGGTELFSKWWDPFSNLYSGPYKTISNICGPWTISNMVVPKVIMQGKLIAVAYTLRIYWKFSLGGICKQE